MIKVKQRKAIAGATRPNKPARVAPSRKAAPKGKPRSAQKNRRKQTFTVSHHREADFKEGLRRYARYRDLGMSEATGGMVQAHVIRFVPPCRTEEVAKRHYHNVDFQMVYVLKGWLKSEFEGQGEIVMQAGSCWIQPSRIEHTVLAYSDDCEVLEVILPAEFETVMLE